MRAREQGDTGGKVVRGDEEQREGAGRRRGRRAGQGKHRERPVRQIIKDGGKVKPIE